MSELFDEVDEELRREQLKKLWDRYSIFIIGAAFLIVAGVAGWRGYTYWEGKRAAEAGAAFEVAVALADQNKHAEAEAAFTKLAAEAPSGSISIASSPRRPRATATAARTPTMSAIAAAPPANRSELRIACHGTTSSAGVPSRSEA